jgi:hypothetical protein
MAKKKQPAAPMYDWGDGRGKIHTVAKADHQQNVQAKQYGIDLNAPVADPLTNRGAYGLAQQAAALQYDPQINQAKQAGANSQAWFQNYLDEVTRRQTDAQKYAAPILQQSQQWAGANPTAAPGLDSSTQAGQQSQQAASSGQNLAQLGYTTLAAIPVSANNYFGGLATTAAQQVPVAQAFYGQQAAQLEGQKGQAVAQGYSTNRQNEQNAQIAYGTLGLNNQKAADDAAADVQTAKDKKAARVVSRKNTRDRITAQTERQDAADAKTEAAAKAKAEKETAKKKAGIAKATGKLRVDVDNTINAWRSYVGQTTDDTSKPKDPTTGEYPARKVTPSDIKRILAGKGYDAGMIHVALMVGAHKPLDAAAINYLHSKDPNIRIPKEWLGEKSSSNAPRPTSADPKPTSGQQNGLGGK